MMHFLRAGGFRKVLLLLNYALSGSGLLLKSSSVARFYTESVYSWSLYDLLNTFRCSIVVFWLALLLFALIVLLYRRILELFATV